MNRKRRNWIIGAVVLVTILGIGYVLARVSLVCCALPPTPPTRTALALRATASLIVALNQTTEVQFHETETNAFLGGMALTVTPTPNPFPYDPTLYAQRRHEEQLLQTAAGPTEYAIFFATETALVTTAESRSRDGNQDVDWVTQTALAAEYHVTPSPTSTPIPYTADMSPTVTPRPTHTRTATPTFCPPSDVICPGGNATMSAADKVMVLMASANAPEFGQLAQTATALAVTPTPTPTSASVRDSNCAFSWAHQDLPEIAEAAREAFSSISSAKIDVIRADAYGENCNRADGSLSYFGAMTTDFYLSANVTDLTDTNQLAQIVRTAYGVLSDLKVKLPAQAGYLDIVFKAGDQEKHFRAMFYQVKQAIDNGKSGAELLAAGGL